MASQESNRVWKKNLYDNQGFPDNYTHSTFLEELKRNVHIKEMSLSAVILGAGIFTKEICTITLFFITFVYLHNGWCDPQILFLYSCLVSLFVFGLYRVLYENVYKSPFGRDIRTVLIFLVFGYISSPVLHTLTDTVSTDTIYLMTAFMMIIHIIFFNYGLSAAIVSSSISLNAAIFGSICLASRLSSPFNAFVLMTISVQCFALFPKLQFSVKYQIFLINLMIVLCIYFLYQLSSLIMLLFICFLLFINILCPFWFLKWYRYKDNIYGPWDEAVVHDTIDVKDILY